MLRHPSLDRSRRKTTLGLLAGAVFGAVLAASAAAAPGESQTVLQLQQDVNNLRITFANTINRLELDVDNLEREAQDLRFRVQNLERDRPLLVAPRPLDTPGTTRTGLLVADTVETAELLVRSPDGYQMGRLGTTTRGPALTLFSGPNVEAGSLIVTEDGVELRLSAPDGGLRAVLSAAAGQGALVLYDADGNEIFRQ